MVIVIVGTILHFCVQNIKLQNSELSRLCVGRHGKNDWSVRVRVGAAHHSIVLWSTDRFGLL
jgi:hypothetical protein